MKHTRHAPAVTSLPQAPQDEATARVRRYWITMGIRMACFALTVLITPYGWYTWVFAAGAAILPYIAVVFANAVSPTATAGAESPTQQLTAPETSDDAPVDSPEPMIILTQERPKDSDA
ncbi:DUF3099 domain-containing protein [Microbacterium sp.]|uniref:DUF3099 domain-containing protein n=1 Tax=Microbacterium sp. TaxID=51671 RepID=UPI00260CE31C|nr:DUF3099 domain-containing protein [Microbacterium sp.]